MRRTLKVLSALLTYPSAELKAAGPQLRAALGREARLPRSCHAGLDRLIEEIATGDLLDVQERYVLLFDRTRSLSLHLFEHVHGESRDRGQAMVDLKRVYERHGLMLSANELPDYLPVFLEFLAQVPEGEARELLAETTHILEAVGVRLAKRGSAYAAAFESLRALAEDTARPKLVEAVLAEPDDDPNDLAALDAAWEEEEVTFGPAAAGQCGKEGLVAKLRAGARPAPGVQVPTPVRPVVTYRAARA